MEIKLRTGDASIAEVFVIKFRDDERFLAECVRALNPDVPPEKKQVLILSTQFGCPVACSMCDAGGNYAGDLTADEIFSQIDLLVAENGFDSAKNCEKFKVQFARMGEPALNMAVLEVLRKLPERYPFKGLMPCLATTAPSSAEAFFEELLDIKRLSYSNKTFQLQLSVNSTSEEERDRLMPVKKWSLEELAGYGTKFYRDGDRKISLNFALMEGVTLDASRIKSIFDPRAFCIKATPLNPNYSVAASGHKDAFGSFTGKNFVEELSDSGFEVILSVGDLRENKIGSNCGQAVRFLKLDTGAQNYTSLS